MKKEKSSNPEMLPEYDFSGGVRGKHYRQFSEGTNLVLLDPDVAEIFSDSDSVNRALRAVGEIIKERSRAAPTRRLAKD